MVLVLSTAPGRVNGLDVGGEVFGVVGQPIRAEYAVDHILAVDPDEMRCKLLRFYPEQVLFRLENGDVCYRIDVREQTSFMSGECLVFVSATNHLKGYWGWSSREYSRDDEQRIEAARLLFRDPVVRRNKAAMEYRRQANATGGVTYLVPVLPLGPDSKSVSIQKASMDKPLIGEKTVR